MKFEKGQTIILSCGAYSAYSILDAHIVLKDFDTKEVTLLYLELCPKQKAEYEFKVEDFVNWLIENQFIKLMPLNEWLIAEYGTIIINEESK